MFLLQIGKEIISFDDLYSDRWLGLAQIFVQVFVVFSGLFHLNSKLRYLVRCVKAIWAIRLLGYLAIWLVLALVILPCLGQVSLA